MYWKLTIDADMCVAAGDLHGSLTAVSNLARSRDLRDAVVFCCGDIGLGFEKPESDRMRFNRLEKALGERNVHAVLLRGNHDDPARFARGFYGREWKHVHVVPDYTVVTVRGVSRPGVCRTALCIGGAVSVDRTERIGRDAAAVAKYTRWHRGAAPGEGDVPRTYWPGEPPVCDEEALDEISRENERLDIVCTHTAPSFCPPLDKGGVSGWIARDNALEADLAAERAVMDRIHARLAGNGRLPRHWAYGHFHFHAFTGTDGTGFHLVDMVNAGVNLPDAVELRFDD